MKVKKGNLPNWTFDVEEASAGVYRLRARHNLGSSFELTGQDPEDLSKRAETDAEEMEREISKGHDLLKFVYGAFNRRDIDAILPKMHPEVEWPNGMEGGWVHGHEGVRAYWTRQWGIVDPHVEPVSVEASDDGRVIVHVHQVVRDLAGTVLLDRMVEHVYSIDEGLIQRMEIRE